LEKIMTEQTQPIHPGCIRIIAQLGHMEGGGDFLADSLPDWIQSLNAETRTPMVRGTEQGVEIAKEIAFEAAEAGEWDVACISALWIALYAPNASVALEDLAKMADTGVVRITASADGCTWRCRVGSVTT
jgi:hypothetical protein